MQEVDNAWMGDRLRDRRAGWAASARLLSAYAASFCGLLPHSLLDPFSLADSSLERARCVCPLIEKNASHNVALLRLVPRPMRFFARFFAVVHFITAYHSAPLKCSAE